MKSILLNFLILTFLIGAAQAAPSERILQLDDGMPIIVTPTVDISSADDETGQDVTFNLLQDCKVDGIVLIAKGTVVNGKIERAKHSKMFGRKGVLEISISDTKAIDGTALEVRTTLESKGNVAKTTEDKVHSILPYGAGFLFNGKDAVLAQGTQFTVFISGTSKFKIVDEKKAFRLKK
jgi:hypothetical protein